MIRTFYFLIILLGCSSPSQQGIVKIDSKKLSELKESGVLVVDIRTPDEFNQGHIPGVIHLDFFDSDFINKMKEQDISKPLILHCASGGRSGKAALMLQKAGFSLIYDYSGGFSDWKSKGLKIEK